MIAPNDLRRLADNLAVDILILTGEELGPSGVAHRDILGTFEANLGAFHAIVRDARIYGGNYHFVDGFTPVDALGRLLDRLRTDD